MILMLPLHWILIIGKKLEQNGIKIISIIWLNMVDLFTKFILDCFIKNNNPDTITDSFIQMRLGSEWVSHKAILADNRGFLANENVWDLCDNLNIHALHTTVEGLSQNGQLIFVLKKRDKTETRLPFPLSLLMQKFILPMGQKSIGKVHLPQGCSACRRRQFTFTDHASKSSNYSFDWP